MIAPLHILVLEDRATDYELMLHELRRDGIECIPQRVETESDYRRQLVESAPSLILADYSLPSYDGRSALALAREVCPEVPFIFVSGTMGEEIAVEALKQGATDYVLKDRLTRLGPSVKRALREADERRQRRQAEENLREAKDRLLRAQRLESIGRLAGGMAHDLNNMLAPLLLSIPALRREAQSDEVRTLLASIEARVQRGTNMVRQVLTFARGAPGPREPVCAALLVREMERFIRETFPRSIQLECALPADPWPVLADSTQLHQVLLNLCVNARDAMPDGGQLRISAENVRLDEASARRAPDAKAGPYLVLAVSDTGIGIRAEDLDRVFEPFFTTKAPDKGTGLGLSTVLGIVKSHGGFVLAESKPGQGARFSVYLPATQTPAQPQRDPGTTRFPRGTGQLILLVDDEKGLLLAGRRLLEKCGYRVLTADDGNQAVDLFARRAREIDLVITDIVMPLLDGAAVVRRILELDPNARIIVTSGDLTRLGSDRATNLGSLMTLWKPFTADLLIQTVHAALTAPQPDQPAHPLVAGGPPTAERRRRPRALTRTPSDSKHGR